MAGAPDFFLPKSDPYCTFSVMTVLWLRLPDVPVTVTVYWPAGVPVTPPPPPPLLTPPQPAIPRSKNRTNAPSVAPAKAR
jgi:hypothetical protein